MKFSYNWLKEYIDGKMPASDKLAELLMFHSFEIEGIEKFGKDWVLDISVLSNRAHDCLSHIGIAREVCAITDSKCKIKNSKLGEDKNLKIKDLLRVEVDDPNDCPRYCAIYLRDIQVKDSPKWIQEKLKACGLQPINNIVDITNYVMLETGQPLHAFDADKLGQQIVVRRAKKGEKIKTLDKEKKSFELDEDILVIADVCSPVAIAGIKGGESTGIEKETRNIVIEAANFSPVLTRRAAQKLKLRTDASWRFENGLDPNLVDFALGRVAGLIQKEAGGKLAQGKVDFYPQKISAKKIQLDLNYVYQLLGLEIPKTKVVSILKALGFEVWSANDKLMVKVPTRRMDVSFPEDLVEEIGRIYGYQNIKSIFPLASLIPPQRNDSYEVAKLARRVLKELGFCEAYNYSFVGQHEKETYHWPTAELFELENPMSSLNKYLRPSLCFGLLRNIKENLKNFDTVKIFEVGSVFKKPYPVAMVTKSLSNKAGERKILSGVLSAKGMKDDGFYELKGAIEELLNSLAISDVWYDNFEATPDYSFVGLWHPGKSAEIKVFDQEIGFVGEIHPQLVDNLGIKERVFMFELDLEAVVGLAQEAREYQPIPFHPPTLRDLAILVPEATKSADILNIIYDTGGDLVRDVDLFDVYSGQEIGEGKENLAFHIVYQAGNRTLSSKEVDEVHKKIITELEKNPEWEVRK